MSTSGRHQDQDEEDGSHRPTNWTYANASDRNSHLPATGPHVDPNNLASDFLDLSAVDEGKWARQLDDNSIHMLVDFTGPTWVQVSGGAVIVALFVKSELETTTTGDNAPVSKLQLDTLAEFGSNIPAGRYKLDHSFTWRRASTSGDAALALVEDIAGTPTTLWAKEKENQDASTNQRSSAGATDEFVVAVAGDFTFDITFTNAPGFGGVVVGVQQARIWLTRIGP